MANRTCYIFAIGGTGSRIVESFTHMLAAGSEFDKLKDWQFVPIIIDLDKNNGNLTRCVQLIDKYKLINDYVTPESQNLNYRFFRYPIKSLQEVTGGEDKLDNKFILSSKNTATKDLATLINYETIGNTENTFGTKHLIDLLYTNSDRTMKLDKGFKGKPHIGAVFFEQFSQSAEFKEGALRTFIDQFDKTRDRIFIISSIFGGTGAAGFPWFVKFLRKENKETKKLEGAKIAALSVQPYFNATASNDSEIDTNSFHTKTKSALKYYSKNLNNYLNAIYYIGDSESEIRVKTAEGGQFQVNDSSPIELIGASSIFHFLKTEDKDIPNGMDGMADFTKTYAYGLATAEKDKYSIYWHDLRAEPEKQKNSRKEFFTPFLHLHICNIMVRKLLPEARMITWGKETGLFNNTGNFISPIWDKSFFTNNFYSTLTKYMELFNDWLVELKGKDDNNHLTYFPLETNPDVGKVPNFDGVLNSIITYSDLTEGIDLLHDVQYSKNETTYKVGKHFLYYNNLINYMNKGNIINDAKKIEYKEKEEKQQAMRLMYLMYNASLQLLSENTAKSLEIKELYNL